MIQIAPELDSKRIFVRHKFAVPYKICGKAFSKTNLEYCYDRLVNKHLVKTKSTENTKGMTMQSRKEEALTKKRNDCHLH